MSRLLLTIAGCALGVSACSSSGRAPSDGAPTPAQTPDRVWFTGASNIRHFTCRAAAVTVRAEAAPEEIERAKSDGLPAIRGALVEIPVQSLDCGISKMNRDLSETLGGEKYPTIRFSLWNYVLLGRGTPGAARMNGLLRIAGKEKVMVVYGNVFQDAEGNLRLRGNRIIDVREYGITPPKRFFGLLHVGKEITVHFDVAVRPLIDTEAGKTARAF